MRSNKLSSFLGLTSFGESHGPAMGLVIEDIKPNVDFPYNELSILLSQRKPNLNEFSSSRNEKDDYLVISGVFEGKTTGMPICILFWNKDAKPEDYEYLKDVFRPGHADYNWYNKFKIYDYRGGGRASGRETISRIAASAFINEYIKPVTIQFQTLQIGTFLSKSENDYYSISESNPFCWPEQAKPDELYIYLNKVKEQKDTVGGIVKVRIDNVPVGLGDPVFEKLNANLAKAIMSIGTIKGISFGDGFEIASLKGSQVNDQMDERGFLSNHSGGISGGISSGQPIIITIAIKPVSSHGKIQQTINKNGNPTAITVSGRHDVCHIPRLLPVIEAMIKLTLADAIAWQKQISGDKHDLTNYREAIDKLDEDLLLLLYRRKAIVKLVKEFKKDNKIEFRDAEREAEILTKWNELFKELDIDTAQVKELLNIVLEISRDDNPVDTL